VRVALGASRNRLVRQFLAESLLLAGFGGALGLLLAHWLVALLIHVAPADIPRVDTIHVDASVLAFACFITLLTALAFGLAPALAASKVDLNESLKEGSGKVTGAGRGDHLRRTLVIAEVAITLVLLAGAGLIFRSFLNLRQVPLGFDPQNVLTLQISPKGPKYADLNRRRDFYGRLLERLEAQPGVVAAGAILIRPLEGAIGWEMDFAAEGQTADEAAKNPMANYEVITPHYFRAIGIPLLKGRDFTEQDKDDAAQVIIISETMARRIFAPGTDPIGRRIKLDPSPQSPWLTIAGVAGDAHYRALDDIRLDVYVPYLQSGVPLHYLAIRTTSDPKMFIPTVRHEVATLDPDQAVTSVMTMEQLVSQQQAESRFNILLLGLFSILATALAGVGIYGVVSYSVAERTHEIGIRIALGAQSADVLRLVIGQALRIVSIGIVIGLVVSFSLSRAISSLLYGVTPTDPLTFIAISLLLCGVALLASYIPARRATQVDPGVALRYE